LFIGTSTAANAIISNGANGLLAFEEASTAGNATITTDSGAILRFRNASSAGFARLITNFGGIVDISGLAVRSPNVGPVEGTTVGSIEGAGTYFLGSRWLAVGGNNLSTSVSGVISDGGTEGGSGGSLVKVGTGTLTLSGFNNYTGTTDVSGGTLVVNGSIALSSLTRVNSGATLAGTGTVGATTINGGGTLAPGNSPGTITIAGNLAFQSGALYLVQIDSSTASSANVSGIATLTGGSVQTVFAPGSYFTRQYTILHSGGLIGTFSGSIRIWYLNAFNIYEQLVHVMW
jgi:autotransporter-associated beta strand protein